MRFSTNWDSYYLELLMCAGIVVYFINLLAGRSKNSKLANAWFNANKEYLGTQFAMVGDDGVSPDMTYNGLVKDTDSVYNLWCSGRVCCEGMLVTLKLLKRQDLVNTITRMFSPKFDQVVCLTIIKTCCFLLFLSLISLLLNLVAQSWIY